ncbi:sensor histidine kinase [Actinoplanes sp. URMC 104]|uniref:sensor histidine kinase n=1 Tax=Actinoplanes sp. URMC 104 TaxID=3423409 RepID=UPI003F1CB9D2
MSAEPLWRHRTRVVDVSVAVVSAATTAGPAMDSTLFGGSPYLPGHSSAVIYLPLALIVGAAALVRRRWPLMLAACALLGWIAAAAYPAVIVGQYALGAYERSRRAVMGTTVVVLLVVGFPFQQQGLDSIIPVTVAVCVAPVLLGLWAGSRREVVRGLRERVQRAEWERQLVADQARAEERARIAHDMHDVVAHKVSLMVLHATAMETQNVPLAGRIRTIGRETLEELRTLVGVLSTDERAPLAPQPTLADLDTLVRRCAETGTPVTMKASGSTRQLPAIIEQVGYRVVQEALTNVHKHAGSADTTVQVRYGQDRLQLTITNRRPASPGAAGQVLPPGGHGLVGLRERVQLVGGRLTAQPTPDGGFEVDADLPIPAQGTV